jgi:hypothetical protein
LRVAASCLRGGFSIYRIDLHDWMKKLCGKSWPPERRSIAGRGSWGPGLPRQPRRIVNVSAVLRFVR